MDPLGIFGGAVAGAQLGDLLLGLAKNVKTIYEDYTNAETKHTTLSDQLEHTKNTIVFAAETLDDVLKQHKAIVKCALNTEKIADQLQHCTKQVASADSVLRGMEVNKVEGKMKFVLKKKHVQEILVDLSPVALLLCVNLSSVIVRLVQWQLRHPDPSGVQGLAKIQEGTEKLLEKVQAQVQETASRATASAQAPGESATVVSELGPNQPSRAGPSSVAGLSHQESALNEERQKNPGNRHSNVSWMRGKAQLLRPKPKAMRKGKKSLPFMSALGRPGTPARAPSFRRAPGSPRTASQGPIDDLATQMGLPEDIAEVPQANASEAARATDPASGASGASQHSRRSPGSLSQVSASMQPESREQHEEPARIEASENPLTDHPSRTSTGTPEPPSSFEPYSQPVSNDSDPTSSWCLNWLFGAPDGALHSDGTQILASDGNRLAPCTEDDLSHSITRILSETQARVLDAEPGLLRSRPTGTLIGMDKFADAPWLFLTLQRPDDWVQLALVPVDCSGSAILLDSIIQVPTNSPMFFELTLNDDGVTTLRLFILIENDREEYALVECRLELGSELGSRRWTIERRELPTQTGSSSSVRWFIWDGYHVPVVQGMSSVGNYFWVFGRTELGGKWCFIEETEFPQSSLLLETEVTWVEEGQPDDATRTADTAYTIDRTKARVTQYESLGNHLSWIRHEDLDFLGHPPDASPASCRFITTPDYRAVGVISRTADNKIYIFRGHPYHDDLRDPERVCAVRPGSHWLYRDICAMLIYVSPEGVLTRLPLGVDSTGEITTGPPSPLFSDGFFVTTLNDLSRKSPLDYYLQRRPPRSNTPTSYMYSDSTLPSSSSSSRASRHPSRYSARSHRTIRSPSSHSSRSSRRANCPASPSSDTNSQAEENQATQDA